MRNHQAQGPISSPLHQVRNNLRHYTSKGPSIHLWTPIPNKQPNSPTLLDAMNRQSPLELSLAPNNHPQGGCGNGYPVQVTYGGGWQQNSPIHQPSAPRSIASENWRGFQPPVDHMNPHLSGINNYSPIACPAPPPAPNNDGGPVSISDCLNGYAYCLKRPDGRYTRLVPADMLPGLNELPATQGSAQGMVLLPDLHMKPPQGVAGMNQPVTVKVRTLNTIDTDQES
jgi:hypothetical protein